ncbi:hypothetical protein [Caldifermentibacillus hisashii]|uniref:hypothetical protein n=1 Tax=Caldifermentibacillus hisashii TaxID=996558 RepID=UPI0031FCD5CA
MAVAWLLVFSNWLNDNIFRQEFSIFDDEPESRHHFEVRNAQFWRRNRISSPF